MTQEMLKMLKLSNQRVITRISDEVQYCFSKASEILSTTNENWFKETKGSHRKKDTLNTLK